MTKTERITKLMELLQASLDGKEIEQVECGHYYEGDIKDVTIYNVNQFRVKPKVITKSYRVALFSNTVNDCYTESLDSYLKDEETEWENYPLFIRWLTPWTEYTVEQ